MLNYFVSKSRIPVYYLYNPNSALVKASIYVHCGSSHEDEDSRGVAHFLEHLCFQGTDKKDKLQIHRDQSLYGNFNAYTSFGETAYYFSGLASDFKKGFELLKESVFDSVYPEHELEKEKGVIVEEWRTYDNSPYNYYFFEKMKFLFGEKEGYNIIGNIDSIKDTNREKITRYVNKWYGPNNMTIVINGGVPFDEVVETIDSLIPDIEDKDLSNKICQSFLTDEKEFKITTSRFTQSVASMYFDFNEIKPLNESLKNDVLNECLQQILYERVRDKLGLCYSISINDHQYGKDKSFYGITMMTNNDNIDLAFEKINESIDEVKKSGFEEEVFAISKKSLLLSFSKNKEAVFGSHNIISNLVSNCSDHNYIFDTFNQLSDHKYIRDVIDNITKNDIIESANEVLRDPIFGRMESTSAESDLDDEFEDDELDSYSS